MVRNFWSIWKVFFNVFFCNIIKVKHLVLFITLLHLISSFLHSRFLFIPYVYISIKSIDRILLLSFEHKAILLISSVKILCLPLLNFCRVFNIRFLFVMNSFLSSLRLSTLFLSLTFFYDTLFCTFFFFIFIVVVF